MLCNVCRNGLEGIWDPSKTKRVCSLEEWNRDEEDAAESQEEAETVPLEDLEPQNCVFGHHVTNESFLQALEDGCVMCNRFGCEGLRNPQIEQHGYYSLFSVRLQVNKALMFMYVENMQGGFSLLPSVADDEDLNSHISASTEDETTWSLIQEWLARCTEQHQACNERPDPTFVPNRLLELDTTGPEKTFRLVQSHDVRPGSRYITLSHCWGNPSGDKDLKLTQTTADTLFTKQPVHILPKTFRDAFAVIERLGIEYLWIDRFCIFQDLLDDWHSESSAVCNIYSNGLLNIAALGAHNSDGGCFFSRDPAHVQATVVQLCIEGPDKPQPYRFELEKGWVWRLSFNRDPLQKRGWTIQERFLAPRVVHFGSKQVFWECGEANCCELHPRSVDLLHEEDELPPRSSGPRALWKHLLDSPHRFIVGDPVCQLFTDWYGIVMQYTECKLSFPSDKLVAISGVAKDMRERLAELGQDTDYLAGLWRCELPRSLVWNIRGTGTRPSAYRAPSWSWAAVDGWVNMAQWPRITNLDDTLLSSLIVAETTPLGDETGQVLTGSVTLKGPLVTVKLSGTVDRFPFGEQALLIERLEKSDAEETLMEHPEGAGWLWSVHFDTKDDICGQVLCLPIKAGKWAEKWNISGLALSRVDDGRYVRIGHLSLTVETLVEAKELFQGLPEKDIVII